MPDPTTTNLVLAVPTRGSDVGTWDVPVNGDMTILDACAGSVTTKTLSNVNVTLSTTESQVSILRFTGALTGNPVITLGAVIKSWVCENLTTGNQVIFVQGNTGTGNIVGLPPGSCQIYWDGTNVKFINLPIPLGGYWDYAGASVPFWVSLSSVPPYLACDGSTYSAVTYPQLNQILGTTTLPDTLGRARFSLDGGSNRITTGGSGISGVTRFAGGGVQEVAISILQMPNHSHTIGDPGHNHTLNNASSLITSGGGSSFGGGAAGSATAVTSNSAFTGITTTDNTGGSTSHTNMPPTYIGGITMIRAA